jgi:hypothetical protein
MGPVAGGLAAEAGAGAAPLVTGLGSPGRGVSLRERLAAAVGEPQDPDPSVGPTFVGHNWF